MPSKISPERPDDFSPVGHAPHDDRRCPIRRVPLPGVHRSVPLALPLRFQAGLGSRLAQCSAPVSHWQSQWHTSICQCHPPVKIETFRLAEVILYRMIQGLPRAGSLPDPGNAYGPRDLRQVARPLIHSGARFPTERVAEMETPRQPPPRCTSRIGTSCISPCTRVSRAINSAVDRAGSALRTR